MRNFVIIGNSAAGLSCAEAIRQEDKQSKIMVVSDEDYPAYCRCLISYYLAGELGEDKLIYRADSFYRENQIQLFLNKKVIAVEPKKNCIKFEDKTRMNYDILLIATGSSPKMPQILGIKKRGVLGFRTIKDAKDINSLAAVSSVACILGGGLIGLKVAYALKKRNVEVKVIVRSKQILSQMLDFQAAGFIQKRLEQEGIEIIFGQEVSEIIGNGQVRAVKLSSGKVIGCSLVVVAKGVCPNTQLLKDASVNMERAIMVDSHLRTNILNIYAAGDVCQSYDLVLQRPLVNALWPMAVEQGRIAGLNMSGKIAAYEGSLGLNSIEFFGLPVISLGMYRIAKEAGYEELIYKDPNGDTYKKLVFKDKYLIGAVLVGDIKQSGLFLRMIKEKTDISPIKHRLLSNNFSYADIVDLVKEKEKIYV
jgi:NAD(P)H-nitrite reductase large subunit